MESIEQLIQSIDGRIRELSAEVAALQDARSVLRSNGAGPTPSGVAPVASGEAAVISKTRRPTSARRHDSQYKSKILTAEAAARMLAEADGVTTAELAKRAGADRDQVLKVLRELETAGSVRRTGQRRATRWHAFTDEDRIRERAAELASRSRR